MKSMRQKLFWLATLIMVGGVCAVILAFNLTLNHYIEQQAHRAIDDMRATYQGTFSEEDFMAEAELDEAVYAAYISPVQAEPLFLTKDYTLPEGDGYISPFNSKERLITDYCRNNPDLSGQTHQAKLAKQEFYVSQSPISDVWDDQTEILVVYANVTPLKSFAGTVNLVFLAVLLLCSLAAGYAGLRLGVRIENAQEKMKSFFENASHELKTPLMSIQGYAEGLLTGAVKDEKQAARIILNESDKMTGLVEEILFTSKLSSGRLDLANDLFSVNELLFDHLRAIEAAAAQKNIRLAVDIPETQLMLAGDETQLAKAVGNILSNALRYAVSEIGVACARKRSDILIEIWDDGPGFTETDLPHIFERFYSGENGHTGIGLFLAKEVIAQHGGTIRAANAEPGARFTIRLPADGHR